MKSLFCTVCGCIALTLGVAQSNITLSNPVAEQVLFGNYNPADFAASTVTDDPEVILNGLVNGVSEDSLLSYLTTLQTFHNRNSGSDTVSSTTGIGAARRWILKKLNAVSQANENRLLTGYLSFNEAICGMTLHRNVFGILPGADTTNKDIVLIEAHMDSRCESSCDVTCFAPGMDDNGSGTVLVMELARIMSQYTFDRTIVFTTVTGEEQGLWGGRAWAAYLANNGIDCLACLNNDIVGGIECGVTSSPPSCPIEGDIDSTTVRIFSSSIGLDSNVASPHKHLARYIKLHQEENINPLLAVPMQVDIEIREDRAGRGGDHIPFRQRGFTAIRVTSKNEHGNGSGNGPDRQHTTGDSLGIDLDVPKDGILDILHVNPGYLRRNSIMNGYNLAQMASSPAQPVDPLFLAIPNGVRIVMQGADSSYLAYRVGVRTEGSSSLDFDTVYSFNGTHVLDVEGLDSTEVYHFCVANVSRGIESMFTNGIVTSVTSVESPEAFRNTLRLLQNSPNPAQAFTRIGVMVKKQVDHQRASIRVADLQGRTMAELPITLEPGLNEVVFHNRNGFRGLMTYSLLIDGQPVQHRKMLWQP